jgi:hypothetical protein
MMLASYPNLSGADLAVAIVIAKHMNSSSGKAWPSLETIAKLTHRDRSTVWRSVRRLDQLKLLAIAKRRGRNQYNVYSALLGEIERDPKTLGRRRKVSPTG